MIGDVAKGAAVLSMMGAFAAVNAPARAFRRSAADRRRYSTKSLSTFCRAGLKIMGVEVDVEGFDEARFAERNYLLVGNHMSYVDALILSAQLPTAFVTSVDMGQAPVLGDLAALAGSIFVERRDRSQVDRDLTALTGALGEGSNVVIFPEGTSTDGRRVLPFKKSLLMSALQAGRDIQPFCLRYERIDGRPFSRENADLVCWHGNMAFAPHYLRLMATKSIRARLIFLDPIAVTAESTRDELAQKSWSAIDAAYFEGRPELRAPADEAPPPEPKRRQSGTRKCESRAPSL